MQLDFTLRNELDNRTIDQRSLKPLALEGALAIRVTIPYLASLAKLHMRDERKNIRVVGEAIRIINSLFFQYLIEHSPEELTEVLLNQKLQKAFWDKHMGDLLSNLGDHPDDFTDWLLSDLFDVAVEEVQRVVEETSRKVA